MKGSIIHPMTKGLQGSTVQSKQCSGGYVVDSAAITFPTSLCIVQLQGGTQCVRYSGFGFVLFFFKVDPRQAHSKN
jgi:hypothetical protein